MKRIISLFLCCLFVCSLELATAQTNNNPWRKASLSELPSASARAILPQEEVLYHLNESLIHQQLLQAPEEFSPASESSPIRLSLPMPNGKMQQFSIVHASMMDPELQAKYPQIRTYAGKGVDDPTALLKMDLTPSGFHAMILSPHGTVFIDPYVRGNTAFYSSYYKKNFEAANKQMICEFDELSESHKPAHSHSGERFGDCQFRTFRLALAATAEYTAYHGGTVNAAMAAQVTTMNRVNGVFERDIHIRMILIPNNDTLIYTNAATDPYSNGNAFAMLSENQSNINSVIGAANYDIGHVFGTNSGGVAGLGVICINNQKSRGVTGNNNPVGDPFDIDYVAHEIGHQLGARHTFNGTAGSCGGNGSPAVAYEPGSGTTIMAYAGICGSQNVQSNSNDYFHAASLEEMGNVISNASCGTIVSTGNNEPTITHGNLSYVIPASTPFFLESTATDVDGDTLTYCWEQFDNQSSTQPPVCSSTGGPLFRSLDPSESPRRYFPKISDVINGTSSTWEVLPCATRNLNFRVTVRDNHFNGGCTDHEDAAIQVDGNSGPFVVNQPSASGLSYQGLSSQLILWTVAGTDQAPVNCSNVDILLSLDGGFTYPITLASNVPNAGSTTIVWPDTSSTTARVMVVCSDGIFFDISDNDFTLQPNTGPNYFLTLNQASSIICAPDTGTITLDVGSVLGYQDPVNLTATISPASLLTATIATNPIIPGNTTTIGIQNTASGAPFQYTLTINATSAAGPQQAIITFDVLPGMPSQAVLTAPADGEIGTTQQPQFSWQASIGATTYLLEVATDSAFTNIIATESGLTSPSVMLSSSLNPFTFYYWRVTAESGCGSNVSPVFSFFTNEATCSPNASTNVPVTIATIPNTITSTLNIPTSGSIAEVKVTNLNGNHSWISDLRFSLTSPGGTTVILMDQVCGNQNNFDIEFADNGAPYNSIPCPPTNGAVFQPVEALSAFIGEDPQGSWTLTVEDLFNQDGGSLNGWGLEICATPSVACNIAVQPQVVDISCNGLCDGMVSLPSLGGSSPYTYSWSDGSTDSVATGLCAGSYTVAVLDDNGCLGASAFQVVEPIPIVISETVVDASCFGASDGSVSFAISGGVAPFSIDLGGADSMALGAGSYTAVITDAGGCSNSLTFTVGQPPEFAIDFGPDGNACDGETVVLDASGLGMNVTYLWSTGETTPSIVVTDSGEYWLLATDISNCTASDTIVLDFLPIPVADFSIGNSSMGTVTFVNTSSNGTYSWDFGDGNTSTDMSPIHTYGDTGAYLVTLIVDLENGCPPDTIQQLVEIFPAVSNGTLLTGTIKVYPNPANEQMIVELKDVGILEGEILLVNHLGQNVLTKAIAMTSSVHHERISLSGLAEGVYHLQLHSEGNTVFTDRVVILR